MSASAKRSRRLGIDFLEDRVVPTLSPILEAGLAGERARRRQRRAGIKRQIAEVEQQERDLVTGRSGPDATCVDLMARYEAGAQRALERDLKALLTLQEARRARDRRARPAG